MIKIGDKVLTKQIKGIGKIISESICWWTNSSYSHIVSILSSEGIVLDATFPKPLKRNLSHYFDGNHRICIIRPVPKFTKVDTLKFLNAADTVFKLIDTKKIGYDLTSYVGYIFNKKIQDKELFNCSESALFCDQFAGRFLKHDGYFITPQSYYEYMIAGAYEVIYQKDYATIDDLTNKVL